MLGSLTCGLNINAGVLQMEEQTNAFQLVESPELPLWVPFSGFTAVLVFVLVRLVPTKYA